MNYNDNTLQLISDVREILSQPDVDRIFEQLWLEEPELMSMALKLLKEIDYTKSRRTDIIFIDYDMPMSELHTDNIKKVAFENGAIEIYWRVSSSGNTHLKVILGSPVGILNTLFIRAILRDDAKRLRADMERYYKGKYDNIGSIFSAKYKIEDIHTTDIKTTGWTRLL